VAIYAWESAVLKAVLETDNWVIYSRITAARSILTDRLNDTKPISEDEKEKIERALHGLQVLEQERVPRHFNF
jgi:hypothetical protein